MMQGDDIRNQRTKAEEIHLQHQDVDTHVCVALWVIAEQLFETRETFAIVLDTLQKQGKL